MKILFMMDRRVNAGSIQAIANYVRAGDRTGHVVAVYGQPEPQFPGIRFSTDVGSFDYVVMVVEFGVRWMTAVRMLSVLSKIPRSRRVILDTDGMYNEIISVDGYDHNHPAAWARDFWFTNCDALVDRVFQPTLEPLEKKTTGLPFYGYHASSEMALNSVPEKKYSVMHVGHNWWRWKEVSSALLPAFDRVRPLLKDICFVGSWWGNIPDGAKEVSLDVAFGFDEDWFRRLGIIVRDPVPYTEVAATMSESQMNIMTQRPLFRRLKILTSKYFEIFWADTIPLPMLEPDLAELVYGPLGRELALYGDVAGKLQDVVTCPGKYQSITQQVRKHLQARHSYEQRMNELVEALG